MCLIFHEQSIMRHCLCHVYSRKKLSCEHVMQGSMCIYVKLQLMQTMTNCFLSHTLPPCRASQLISELRGHRVLGDLQPLPFFVLLFFEVPEGKVFCIYSGSSACNEAPSCTSNLSILSDVSSQTAPCSIVPICLQSENALQFAIPDRHTGPSTRLTANGTSLRMPLRRASRGLRDGCASMARWHSSRTTRLIALNVQRMRHAARQDRK